MIRRILLIITASVIVEACSNCQDEWHSTHLIHDIYLEWVYHPEEQYISLGSWDCGIGGNVVETDPGVFAVGYDSSFIIAKQHPIDTTSVGKKKLDKTKTNYYIINIKNYPKVILVPDDITVLGNENIFFTTRDSLGVSKTLDFTLISKNLE